MKILTARGWQNISLCRGGKAALSCSVQSDLKTAQEREVTKDENLAGFRKAALMAVSQ